MSEEKPLREQKFRIIITHALGTFQSDILPGEDVEIMQNKYRDNMGEVRVTFPTNEGRSLLYFPPDVMRQAVMTLEIVDDEGER